MKTLPVSVLSGFSGAGKTTVLKHLVKHRRALRVAVIVNSMRGIEENLKRTCEVSSLGENDVKLIELSEGCICCTLRGKLLQAVTNLTEAGPFDALLIESAGIAEPMAIAETFGFAAENGKELAGSALIDTMVTVVDAQSFLENFQSTDELRDRNMGIDADDSRDIARLLIDQIEFANVILLNKSDLVSAEVIELQLEILRRLNPDARVLAIQQGQVDVDEIINTGHFQQEWTVGSDGWQAAVADDESSVSNASGICSFVYRARRPFHPQRFWDFWMTGDHGPNILRSKGYFWLATRHAIAGFWSHTGQVISAEPGGAWWAETPREEWPSDDRELLAELASVWDDIWGDRRQELLIIAQDLDVAAARESLNACLLTDPEMQSGPSSWARFDDPFGSWDAPHICDKSHDHDHD